MSNMIYGAKPVNAGMARLPYWWRGLDKTTLFCVVALMGIGLILSMAASVPLANRNGLPPFYYVERQVIFGSLSLVTMIAISLMTISQVKRLGLTLFTIAIISLMLLPVFGSSFGKGATRWFSLGFITVQPSEFLKPGYVLTLAWLMSRDHLKPSVRGRWSAFAVMIFVAALLVIQPDYGQTALILFGWGVLFFVANAPFWLIMGSLGLISALSLVAYNFSAHFARRIDGFLSPQIDPHTQIGFATHAIQEGGLFGVGVGEGRVKWSLPDAHTDFILAVAAEEYGYILVAIIVILFASIILRSLWKSLAARDPFVRLATIGLASILGIQAFVNMGVAIRLLPNKGMTLPFISYGGSSVLAVGLTMGMLLAMTRKREEA